MQILLKPALGLFSGVPGSREYRKYIDSHWRDSTIPAEKILLDALELIPESVRRAPRGESDAPAAPAEGESISDSTDLDVESRVEEAVKTRVLAQIGGLPPEAGWKVSKYSVPLIVSSTKLAFGHSYFMFVLSI